MDNDTRDTDILFAVRPDRVTQERWDFIKAETAKLIRQQAITAAAAAGAEIDSECAERAWCIVTDPSEHAKVHSSDVIELTDPEATNERRWWCWLSEDRTREVRLQVCIEGRTAQDPRLVRADVDARSAVIMLLASATPETRAMLQDVLTLAIGRVPDSGPPTRSPTGPALHLVH